MDRYIHYLFEVAPVALVALTEIHQDLGGLPCGRPLGLAKVLARATVREALGLGQSLG
jgi:hypothetical protein